MSKGRKPIPDSLKVLRGTDQKTRMRGSLEVPALNDITGIVDVKKFTVLKSKRAKDIFIDKANQLIKLKLLTEMDIEQLVIYASSLDILFTCMKEMKKDLFKEIYAEDKEGNIFLKGMVPNPYIKLYREMIEITNKIGSDFGFSPVSRMKLKAEKEKEVDPFEKLMQEFK